MNYFKGLFASTDNVSPASLILVVEKKNHDDCAITLCREVSKQEFWQALKFMKPFKASGPNSFQLFFL